MLLFDVNVIVLILGGVLAISGLIVAKKPDAKQLIDKLSPYQALIGVGLVALGVINFLRIVGYLTDMFHVNLLLGAVWLCVIGCSVLLGALFGMPQITKWIPGNSTAEQKALELTQKLAPYQVVLGLVGVASSLIYFLYRFHILTMSA